MPVIRVGVSRWVDWEPVDPSAAPIPDDVVVLSALGVPVHRVTHDEPSVTSIGMAESEVTDQMAFAERMGRSANRLSVIANYVENVVMPGHTAGDQWSSIDADEPELAAYLQQRFNLPGATA